MSDEIYRNACATIARRVGLNIVGSPVSAVEDLAQSVGLISQIKRDPIGVAQEITSYLDDIVRDP